VYQNSYQLTTERFLNKVKIFNLQIYGGDREEILKYIENKVLKREVFQLITINALMVNYAFENPEFFEVLKSGLCVNDSTGISIACFILKGRFLPRFQGIELFLNLLAFCQKQKLKVFLYGAEEKSNQKAQEKVKKFFPDIKVDGINGYTDPWEKINAFKPDFIFVGLSLPEQELWIYENLKKLNCPAMGIGGSLDVISGRVRRAYYVFRVSGLEWCWRLINQPQRIKRILKLPVFVARILSYLIFGRIIL